MHRPAGARHLGADERLRREGQELADGEARLAAIDTTSADADQVLSDTDRHVASREQHAADRDQAAADRDSAEAAEGSRAEQARERSRVDREDGTRSRELTAEARERTTARRLATAAQRDAVADLRDLSAVDRDAIADAQDAAAEGRDREAEALERLVARTELEADDHLDGSPWMRSLRLASASVRQQASLDRIAAAVDRRAAADDRARAAADRRGAGRDELTGTLRRGAGELALREEVGRARDLGNALVLCFVDVDHLKAVNDAGGHAAGDELLRDVAAAIGAGMRAGDLVVRWGGDEFVCALPGATEEVALARIAEVRSALEVREPPASVSAGLATLRPDDGPEHLVLRADGAMREAKRVRR